MPLFLGFSMVFYRIYSVGVFFKYLPLCYSPHIHYHFLQTTFCFKRTIVFFFRKIFPTKRPIRWVGSNSSNPTDKSTKTLGFQDLERAKSLAAMTSAQVPLGQLQGLTIGFPWMTGISICSPTLKSISKYQRFM